MSPRRFLVPPQALAQEMVELPLKEAAHARRVLRLKEGDAVILMDGQGRSAPARIVQVNKKTVLCRMEQVRSAEPLFPRLVICPGLLKAPAMDLLAVKLTELAVDEVRPVICRRSVPQLKDAPARLARWERLGGQALKQSGASRQPLFHPPMPLVDFLAEAPAAALRLMIYEKEPGLTLAQALANAKNPPLVWALIGPEGGFSGQEAQAARLAGFNLCGLPGPILRAETACLAVAAVIRFGGRT